MLIFYNNLSESHVFPGNQKLPKKEMFCSGESTAQNQIKIIFFPQNTEDLYFVEVRWSREFFFIYIKLVKVLLKGYKC